MCVFSLFLLDLILVLSGAVVAPAFTTNIYPLTNIIKCLKCNRVVGNVLANGDYDIWNTRVVKYQTVYWNMESEFGQEMLLKSVSEQRSLHGKYQGHKRHSIELDIDEPLLKRPKFNTELQCFRAEMQYDDWITSVPFEDLPIFPEEEDDENILSVSQQNDQFYDEDVFFDQDTVAFPSNMMSIREPDVILTDYETVSFDAEFFARPYFSPFNVYHPNDGDNSEWLPLLSVDPQFLLEDEMFLSENGPIDDDNISDFFYSHSLSSDNHSTNFNDDLLNHFAEIANNIVVCDSSIDDEQ